MSIYTAEFHTNAEWALLDIRAATPEKALIKARMVDPEMLEFEPYGDRQPMNYITVRDKSGNDLAEWQAGELRLQKAAPQLLEALEELLECQKFGVNALARQVQRKGEAIAQARIAIAKAKGGAP